MLRFIRGLAADVSLDGISLKGAEPNFDEFNKFGHYVSSYRRQHCLSKYSSRCHEGSERIHPRLEYVLVERAGSMLKKGRFGLVGPYECIGFRDFL